MLKSLLFRAKLIIFNPTRDSCIYFSARVAFRDNFHVIGYCKYLLKFLLFLGTCIVYNLFDKSVGDITLDMSFMSYRGPTDYQMSFHTFFKLFTNILDLFTVFSYIFSFLLSACKGKQLRIF